MPAPHLGIADAQRSSGLPVFRLACLIGQDSAERTSLIARLRPRTSRLLVMDSIADLIAALRATALEPDYVLIELQDDHDGLFLKLDQLADEMPVTTSVFGYGALNDVDFYRTLLALGFEDYFVLPLDESKLDGMFKTLRSNRMTPDCPVLGFVGLGGGVGTTTIAINFAAYLARSHAKRIGLVASQSALYCALPFYREIGKPSDEHAVMLRYIAALSASDEAQESDPSRDHLSSWIDTERMTADSIIIDIGTQMDQQAALSRCDSVILIGEPDFKSLANGEAIIRYLATHFPFANRHLALTKIGLENRIEFGPEDFYDRLNMTPLMLYRHDAAKMSAALAGSVPLLPHDLLKDRQAFEKLAVQCHIPFAKSANAATATSDWSDYWHRLIRLWRPSDDRRSP